MKYINELILGGFLKDNSLKGIEINKITLTYDYKSKELLDVFYVILKNKNNINNSNDLIESILIRARGELFRLIYDKKPVDPYLEEIISNSIEESIRYIKNINQYNVNTGFKIDEKKVIEKNNSQTILDYVEYFTKKRFPEAEHVILNDINVAIKYCFRYIGEPWKELEEKIEELNDRMYLYYYIIQVLSPYYKEKFPGQNIRSLIQKNYPLYEQKLINGTYKKVEVAPIYAYAKQIINGRWLEFEKIIEDKINAGESFYPDDCHDFSIYMVRIYPGRWKIAEPYFIDSKKGYPKLEDLEYYINKKVIPEYQKNINTFEDLEKYKNEFIMWDKLLQNNEIIFIFNPVYTIIKLGNLINYRDKETVKKLLKEYFPLNYKEHIEPRI